MGRFKIPMERINDDKKRKLAYQTRKKGLIKKARELSTLCDVNVSMIIRSDLDQEPLIFPPDDPHKFNNLMDLYRQNRMANPGKIRYYSLSDFFKEKTMKVEEELAEVKKKNLAAKYPTWFDFLNNYNQVELRQLAEKLDTKIHHLKNKLNNNNNNTSKIQINQDNTNTTYPDDHCFDQEELSDDENTDPACPRDDVDLLEELLGDDYNDPCPEDDVDHEEPPPPEILPSSSDQNILVIKQSSNPNSLHKFPIGDDHNHFRPTPPQADTGYCFSQDQEILKQPELAPIPLTKSSIKLQLNVDDSRWYRNITIPCPAYCSSSPVIIQQQPETHDQLQQIINECFIDDHNFSLQPPPPSCFQPETPQPHPELPAPLSNQYDLMMQSSKPDSMMKLLMSEDDNDYCDHDNFSLQLPPAGYCFTPKIQLQPEPPLAIHHYLV